MHEELHVEPRGERIVQVPQSAGIPPIVWRAVIASIVLIFIVGGLVLSQAGYGHMWPAENTLRLKL